MNRRQHLSPLVFEAGVCWGKPQRVPAKINKLVAVSSLISPLYFCICPMYPHQRHHCGLGHPGVGGFLLDSPVAASAPTPIRSCSASYAWKASGLKRATMPVDARNLADTWRMKYFHVRTDPQEENSRRMTNKQPESGPTRHVLHLIPPNRPSGYFRGPASIAHLGDSLSGTATRIRLVLLSPSKLLGAALLVANVFSLIHGWTKNQF